MASEHFQPKIIPRGSTLYYALLRTTPAEKKAAQIVYTFCQEMKMILSHVVEVEVTKAKLNWWQGEIGRLYAKTPQHPLSHALLPIIEKYQLLQDCFQDVITGTLIDLEHPHFQNRGEQLIYCQKTGGAKNNLFCQLFIQHDPSVVEYSKLCGIASQLIYFIRNLGLHIRQGRCYFSEEDLNACALTTEHFFQQPDTKSLQLMLAKQAERAREYYAKANQVLSEKNRYRLLPSLTYANLSLALLDEMARDDFAVLKHQYKLTPLFKLWVAWRTQRHEKQRAKRFSDYLR